MHARKTPAPKKKDDFDWTQQRVKRLFIFLNDHHQWNREFQQREYERCLAGCTTQRERLVQFLHWNVNTQQKADLNDLEPFWRLLHRASNKDTATLRSFTAFLCSSADGKRKASATGVATPTEVNVWESLYKALRAHAGWGEKTSALFVKATIQLHRGPVSLQFWPDATPEAAPLDSFRPYLPVDRVILRIFQALKHPCPRFSNINKKLRAAYTAEEMLVWDDLWFWGFFTQKSKGKRAGNGDENSSREGTADNSVLEWNPGKFWGLLSSPKEQEQEVRGLGEQFLTLLK